MTKPVSADPKMYWLDHGWDLVRRATLEGTSPGYIARDFISSPGQMALDLAQGKMYWSDSGSGMVHRANLDGTNVEKLLDSLWPRGLALDLTAGKMYWSDTDTDTRTVSIHRADLDGDNAETLLSGLGSVWGIAFDPVDRMIYFCGYGCVSSRCFGSIYRWRIDGSGDPEHIVTSNQGLNRPIAVAVDTVGRKLYWVDTAYHVVQRSDLDGANMETLLGTGSPEGITLDLLAGKMYWTGRDEIRCANLDGSDPQLLLGVSQLGDAVGIAVDPAGGRLYWTDKAFDSISRADLVGRDPQVLVSEFIERPNAIAISVSTNRIYWTDWQIYEILVVDLAGGSIRQFVPSGTTFPFALAVDDVNGHVYWSDFDDDTIRRADLEGNDAVVLVSDAPVQVLAVDAARNHLYWADSGLIYRSDLSGAGRTELLTFGPPTQAHGFAVDSDAEMMYWSNAKAVFRARTDGTEAHELFEHPYSEALALDVDAGKLYLTASGGTFVSGIFRSDLDGSHFEELGVGIINARQPRGIALDVRTVPGDCTRDGVVSKADVQWLIGCLTGPAEAIGVGCGCGDVDQDTRVDLLDFSVLQRTIQDKEKR